MMDSHCSFFPSLPPRIKNEECEALKAEVAALQMEVASLNVEIASLMAQVGSVSKYIPATMLTSHIVMN